jgi:hypothetical protein
LHDFIARVWEKPSGSARSPAAPVPVDPATTFVIPNPVAPFANRAERSAFGFSCLVVADAFLQ